MKKSFGYINRCMKRNMHRLKNVCTLRAFRKPSAIPEVIVALSYNQMYNDFATVNPKDFIKGIPTFEALSFILKLECDIHYTLHNPEEDYKHISLFNKFCDDQEREKLESAMKRRGRNLLLINTEGTLRFVRLALTCYEPEMAHYTLSEHDKKNIFKAYLYCNQLWTNEQLNNNVFAFSNLVDASLRIDLPFSEFKYFKDFRTQMYKSIRFFKFAEGNEILNIILAHFCKERKVVDWKEYVHILFGFFQASMNSPLVDMSEAPEQVKEFMSPYLLDTSALPWKDNMRGKLPNELRDKFILRSTENPQIVMILSSDLLVDKIYQGLKFDFAKIAEKYGILNMKGKPITQTELNSILGRDFSEAEILYSVLDLIYSGNQEYYRKSGAETISFFSQKDGSSEPDYYMRKGDKLMFIENKDVLFPVDVKYSKKLLDIKQSISQKIARYGKYPDQRNRKKQKEQKEGLGQIFFNIFRLAYKPELYKAFDGYIDIVNEIYPILVTYDNAYSAFGVNAYANKKISGIKKRLKKRFTELYGYDADLSKYTIHKPVIVDIDTLIMYSLKLKKQELDFFGLLDEYNSLVGKYDDNLSSFNTFMIDHHKLSTQGEDFIKLLYGDILEEKADL